eukprot:875756-Prorocentrum_minimum.AAC.1
MAAALKTFPHRWTLSELANLLRHLLPADEWDPKGLGRLSAPRGGALLVTALRRYSSCEMCFVTLGAVLSAVLPRTVASK